MFVDATIRWPGAYGENVLTQRGILANTREPGIRIFVYGSGLAEHVTAHLVGGRWWVARDATLDWSEVL